MLINRILFVLVLIPFAMPGWALHFSTYEELSQDLICLAKAPKDEKKNIADPLLNKLGVLKNQGDDRQIYEQLEKVVKTDDGLIKLIDLAQVLEGAQKKFQSEPVQDSTKIKLVNLFESLLSGKKSIQNVAIIGHTRGGKSTFLATMLDPLDQNLHASLARWSIFSHTVNPSHHVDVVDSNQDGLYAARYIDTPGLSEVKSVESEIKARSDQKIIAQIAESLGGLKVDRVIQIFPISSSGLNPEDTAAFKLIKEAFDKAGIFKGKIDIVFPRVDEMGETQLERLIKELKRILPRYNITEKDYGKFYMSGSLFNRDFESGFLNPVLNAAPRILFYRNQLLKDIFGVPFSEGLVTTSISGGKTNISLKPEVRKKIGDIIPPK